MNLPSEWGNGEPGWAERAVQNLTGEVRSRLDKSYRLGDFTRKTVATAQETVEASAEKVKEFTKELTGHNATE